MRIGLLLSVVKCSRGTLVSDKEEEEEEENLFGSTQSQ